MSDLVRLVLLLCLAGAAFTALGGAVIWFLDEERRIRRSLKHVLGAPPEAVVSAHGRGAGFAFSRGALAVTWDQGAWCMVYRLDELVGAEVLVDGEVMGRAYRGEPRRPLDKGMSDAALVRLRLLFDDPAHPDFEITLWTDDEEPRKGPPSPASAAQEANRWLARAEAILRRQGGQPKVAKAAPAPEPPPPQPMAPAPAAAPAMAAATPPHEPPVAEDDDDPPF
jgi:hypothetical protein